MFSGRRMWLYLAGSFVNAVVMTAIPLCVFQTAQSIEGGMSLLTETSIIWHG